MFLNENLSRNKVISMFTRNPITGGPSSAIRIQMKLAEALIIFANSFFIDYRTSLMNVMGIRPQTQRTDPISHIYHFQSEWSEPMKWIICITSTQAKRWSIVINIDQKRDGPGLWRAGQQARVLFYTLGLVCRIVLPLESSSTLQFIYFAV